MLTFAPDSYTFPRQLYSFKLCTNENEKIAIMILTKLMQYSSLTHTAKSINNEYAPDIEIKK